jgi:hypothetical protein
LLLVCSSEKWDIQGELMSVRMEKRVLDWKHKVWPLSHLDSGVEMWKPHSQHFLRPWH